MGISAYFKKNIRPAVTAARVNSREMYLAYKSQAEKLVRGKVGRFNGFYKFEFHRISIRNQKTRWGSCSSRGNLNFNYKIIFLPDQMADYIVAHELCHLKEMNHSRRFWDLVARTIPDYKIIKKDLRRKGIALS